MLGIGDNAELQPLPLRRSEFDSSFYYLDADKLRTDDKYAALRMELVAEHGPDGIQFEGKPEPYRFYYCNHVDDSRLIGNSVVLMSAFSAAFASKYTVTGGDTNYNRERHLCFKLSGHTGRARRGLEDAQRPQARETWG